MLNRMPGSITPPYPRHLRDGGLIQTILKSGADRTWSARIPSRAFENGVCLEKSAPVRGTHSAVLLAMSLVARCAFLIVTLLSLPHVVVAEQPEVRPSWADAQVRYYVNPVNSDVSPAAAAAAVQVGALAWSTQSQANFNFFYAGETDGVATTYNLKNEVIFRNATDGDAIATAYTWSNHDTILDSDIIFWDAAYPYFTGSTGCVGGFFVEDIAAHEFGHAAGIGHSEVPGSTMSATVDYCSTSARTLGKDDLDQIEGVYPPNSVTRPPSAPASLTANPSAGRTASSIDLFWTDTSSDEDVFVVQRSTDGFVFAAIGQTSANVTSFVDRPLQAETAYWYRVTAGNAGGQGDGSNVVFVQTTFGPPPPAAPTTPTPANRLTGVSRDTQLQWRSGRDAQSFDIYFGTTDPPPLYARDVPSPAVSLRGLSPLTTYYWSVFANNEGGSSSAEPWQFTTGVDAGWRGYVIRDAKRGRNDGPDEAFQP